MMFTSKNTSANHRSAHPELARMALWLLPDLCGATADLFLFGDFQWGSGVCLWRWGEDNMAVSTQLGLLLWKNFTYRRRQTVSAFGSISQNLQIFFFWHHTFFFKSHVCGTILCCLNFFWGFNVSFVTVTHMSVIWWSYCSPSQSDANDIQSGTAAQSFFMWDSSAYNQTICPSSGCGSSKWRLWLLDFQASYFQPKSF